MNSSTTYANNIIIDNTIDEASYPYYPQPQPCPTCGRCPTCGQYQLFPPPIWSYPLTCVVTWAQSAII